jgi:DNA-binding protein HU-beta
MAIVNKDELIRDVAGKSGLEVGQAKRALEATLKAIEEQVGQGNEVRLTGFGKFSVSHRAARQGRNPRTGETMEIAAKSVPRFSAGAELKKAAQ